MLVLSRQKNESIVIADGLIEVVVVEIRGDKVRLGFSAPKDVTVHRKEVADKIAAALLAAGKPDGESPKPALAG